jgi:hypothetical protein
VHRCNAKQLLRLVPTHSLSTNTHTTINWLNSKKQTESSVVSLLNSRNISADFDSLSLARGS